MESFEKYVFPGDKSYDTKVLRSKCRSQRNSGRAVMRGPLSCPGKNTQGSRAAQSRGRFRNGSRTQTCICFLPLSRCQASEQQSKGGIKSTVFELTAVTKSSAVSGAGLTGFKPASFTGLLQVSKRSIGFLEARGPGRGESSKLPAPHFCEARGSRWDLS